MISWVVGTACSRQGMPSRCDGLLSGALEDLDQVSLPRNEAETAETLGPVAGSRDAAGGGPELFHSQHHLGLETEKRLSRCRKSPSN